MTFLVIFDSTAPEAQKELLITNLKRMSGTWARITPNAWLLTSVQDAVDVRDSLKTYIPDNKIIVLNVTGDAWATSRFPDDVAAWIKDNL